MFFPHDNRADEDPKSVALLRKHGSRGYGVYWRLIERLHCAETLELETDFAALAWVMRERAALVESVVRDFGLFEFSEDGTRFFSTALNKRCEKRISRRLEISEVRREAGRASAEARKRKREEAQATSETPTLDAESQNVERQEKTFESPTETTQETNERKPENNAGCENEKQKDAAPEIAPDVFESNAEETDDVASFESPPYPADELIALWNEYFGTTKQRYRGLQLDAVSHERAKRAWEEYGDLQTFRKAFETARLDKFPWLLRDALKPENIQRLIAKEEKENELDARAAPNRAAQRRDVAFGAKYDFSRFSKRE